MTSQSVTDMEPMEDEGIALYIHIPFCQTKCPYCDFNTYQGIEALMTPYVQALAQEIRLWGETLSHPRVGTVFFGGGTPSYLPAEHIGHILSEARSSFNVVQDGETTLEANPDDVTGGKLEALLKLGINRLSIGVQSLDDGLLKMLGRRHSAAEAVEAYRLAGKAGFQQVNIDLMYGLPQQSMDQWRDTLKKALELQPPHISLYCLTLEKGTPLERWVRDGALPDPDADLAAEMYTLAGELLGETGYHHYEISSWALPGYKCQHNLIYWRNQPYLGVGPGAHSYLHGHRFYQVKSPRLYVERVGEWTNRGATQAKNLDGALLQNVETLEAAEPVDLKLEMAETVFLGLRLLDGLELKGFHRRFGVDLTDVYEQQVRELTEVGLLEQANGALRLTKRGVLLSNQVFVQFL